MATTWKAPTWRMPNDKNQNKFESYSLDFDGSNEYINLGNDSVLTPPENITISCWVNITNGGHINGYYVGKIHTTGNSASYGINKKQPEFFVRTTGGSYVVSPQANSIVDVGWTHLVGTYDGSYARLYVNGVEVGTGTAGSGAIEYTTEEAYIGAFEYYTPTSSLLLPIEGKISEVSIFDYALSSTQVSSLYNSGSPINPMTLKPAPIANYLLGGDASTGGDPLTATTPDTLSVPNVAVPDASVFDFTQTQNIQTNTTLTNFGITNEFTVSFWVNLDALFGYSTPVKSTTSSGWTDGFGVYYNGNKWNFFVDHWSNSKVTSNTTVIINQWYHIVGTFSSSGTIKLYINGSEEGTPVTGITLDGLTTSPVIMGGTDGKMSNFQLWNKELIDSEVTTLYNNGQPLMTGTQPQEANLKAWYKLDQLNSYWNIAETGNWTISNEAIN